MKITARRLAASLAAIACAAVLAGCGDDDKATRDSDNDNEVTEAGEADVFSLQVGDCFNDEGAGGEISDVPAVPCEESHDNEVYHSFEVEGDEWPGDEAIATAAEDECGPQFETFAGISYDESVLDWGPITPTEGSWSQDDREILCIVWDSEGPVEGSLEGAGR